MKSKSCDFHLSFFSRYVSSCMYLLTTKNRRHFTLNVNDNGFSTTDYNKNDNDISHHDDVYANK